MKFLNLYILLLSFITISGCKKYLDKEPTAQSSIKTAEQLESLVNNINLFVRDGTFYASGFTDHTELPSDWANNTDNLYYTFKTDEIAALANDFLYNDKYKQIFTANVVLTYADKVTGDETLKNELKADAYFIRAYAYWFLANIYCLPYAGGKNEDELGMTLKRTTLYEETYQRSTLKQTYDFILSDLNEAMKTSRDDVDPKKPWRVSKKAVAAFLSRVHLFMGNYDEALTYANTALSSTTAQLVDFHTIKAGTPGLYTNPADTLRYSELNDWGSSQWLYWKEFYFPRVTTISASIPSAGLLSLYDQKNDLRFKWFMIAKFNRSVPSKIPYYGYVFFSRNISIPTSPTVAEVLLNKAEVLARAGNVNAAMAAVNTLREKRMNTPAPLSATDKDDAIKKVLEERRREMPLPMRWFDIRRFSVNDYSADDVTVKHTYWKVNADGTPDRTATEVYTLAPGSRKWALPFSNTEIALGKGGVNQNQY